MKKRSPKWPRGATTSATSTPAIRTAAEAEAAGFIMMHPPRDPTAPVEPPEPAAPPAAPPPLDVRDPPSVLRWQEGMRTAMMNIAAAAQEGARRPRKRVLSRSGIRRQAREGLERATALLDLAVAAVLKV